MNFTPKELIVLLELRKGKSSKEIAITYSNSVHTIDTHRRKMLKKAEAKNTRELLFLTNEIVL